MSPRELSKLIVDAFREHYLNASRDGGGINTQSAIDLNAIPGTIERIKALSSLILSTYGNGYHTELVLERGRTTSPEFPGCRLPRPTSFHGNHAR